MSRKQKSVFVTVGTTSFDRLISIIDSPSMRKTLVGCGYNDVTCQIGNGSYLPDTSDRNTDDLSLTYFRLKDSISEDIRRADLVISHAGAGSILESLGEGKPLVVVVNEELMGNHQMELARKMADQRHLLYCNCGSLENTLLSLDTTCLMPFRRGQTERFARFMDQVMGLS